MNSQTVTIHTFRRFLVCQARHYSPALQEVLNDLENQLTQALIIFKRDKTSTVGLIQIQDQRYVVKKASTKSFCHAIRRLFQSSRARKNWMNACVLKEAGILTFEPIAMVENRFGPLKGCNYLLMSYLEGQDALSAYRNANEKEWSLISEKIVGLIQQLHHAKIMHNDLNLSNFLFVKDRPYLIDLDGMQKIRFGWQAKSNFKREKARFLENCRDVGLPHKAQEILRKMLVW